MRKIACFTALAAGLLSGCAVVETSSSTTRTTSAPRSIGTPAETACVARANRVAGGSARVVSSEYSEANSLITLGDGSGRRYRCLAANDGTIAEFGLL